MLRPVCGTVRSRRTVLLGRELRVPPRRVRHDGVRRTVVPRAVRGTEELRRNAGTGHPAGGRRTASYPQTTPRQHGTGRRPYRASYPSYPFPQNWRRTVVVPASYPSSYPLPSRPVRPPGCGGHRVATLRGYPWSWYGMPSRACGEAEAARIEKSDFEADL
jgi:hypothetical protein